MLADHDVDYDDLEVSVFLSFGIGQLIKCTRLHNETSLLRSPSAWEVLHQAQIYRNYGTRYHPSVICCLLRVL